MAGEVRICAKHGPYRKSWWKQCQDCVMELRAVKPCAICGGNSTDKPTSDYCALHWRLIARLHSAEKVRHAYLNGYEDELLRVGLSAFDTVYVLGLIGYDPPLCKFGVTRHRRRGFRLAEHGRDYGAIDVIVYQQTSYAIEIENELKAAFGHYGIGRSKELLSVVPATMVAEKARELLSLPLGALGYTTTPLGVYVPTAKTYRAPRSVVTVFGRSEMPEGAPLAVLKEAA